MKEHEEESSGGCFFCCCCSGGSQEHDEHDEGNPGPDIQRRCTDICCLFVLIAVMSFFTYLLVYLRQVSSTDILTHGHDHYRNMCGRGDFKDRKTVYYPDLHTDFVNDPTLRKHYGVCTSGCPEPGTMLHEYNGTSPPGEPAREGGLWYVSLPSFNFLGRCIPYEPQPNKTTSTELCAYPMCDEEIMADPTMDKIPTKAEQVCGLERDGTFKNWLLSEPDPTVIEGWRTELLAAGRTEVRAKEIIDARVKVQKEQVDKAKKDSCRVVVDRGVSVSVSVEDHKVLYKVLTKYTGQIFQAGKAAYDHRWVIIGLGLGGSLVASFVIIILLTCFARVIVILLLALFFLVLSVTDYILFVQAGILTGTHGKYLMQALESATDIDMPKEFEALLVQSTDTESLVSWYKWGAIILAAVILLLVCVVCAIWKKFEILIALLQEASRTMREMPSLVLFPLVGYASMIIVSVLFMMMLLGVATMDETQAEPFFKVWLKSVHPALEALKINSNDPFVDFQRAFVWTTIFGLLWAYFFHVACFIGVVAMAVSHWYFYRDDPEKNAGTGVHSSGWFFGRPVLLAMFRLARYHAGTMAVGSFIMALVTMPRLILEYMAQHTDAEANQVTKALLRVARCCLYCFEKCIKFLTEYAYIYTAITGRAFCPAAMSSFKLFAEYPVQVALDKMACWAMRILACTVVPGLMVVFSYLLIPKGWLPCAIIIAILSYITTRLTVGVYDVSVTTLFACAMRDKQLFGGKYMPYKLRVAVGFEASDDDAVGRQSVRQTMEMREGMGTHGSHPPLPPQFSMKD